MHKGPESYIIKTASYKRKANKLEFFENETKYSNDKSTKQSRKNSSESSDNNQQKKKRKPYKKNLVSLK